MKTKSQSISEYVVLLAIVTAALTAMQIYYKRSIQAVVKVAADDLGQQKPGAWDYDYRFEWKERGAAQIQAETTSSSTTKLLPGGAESYEKSETTQQKGITSQGIIWEKE